MTHSRRSFMKASAGLALAAGVESPGIRAAAIAPDDRTATAPPFKLGLVTYDLAKDWDIETIIKNCEAAGFAGVELRTTHRHGIEPSISKERRAEARRRFADSQVRLVSLGSTCEYESPDAVVVERNIDQTRAFCQLAHDVGAMGVKVRPNGFPRNSDHARVLEQIGRALHRCGDIARDLGVEVWLEVHGNETQNPPNIHRIMQVCDHPSVGICWNSNDTDVVEGSVKPSFDLLKPWLRSCHINELWRTVAPWGQATLTAEQMANPGFTDNEWAKPYPWHELFTLFRGVGYNRYTFAEVAGSCEPIRFMHYYRSLWQYHAA